MDFAKNILSKYGWKDGDGLGKEKQGIKKPIKANLKFDSAGLGATNGEFGNNWWERCFNDAAQNVKVQKEQNGKVTLDLKNTEETVEVSTKSYSVKKLKSSGNGVYGNNFMSSDVSVASFEMTKYKVLTDEELFQACGGRTAHKGARHGLKLSGKLARIEQQEREMLAMMQKKKASQTEAKEKERKIESKNKSEEGDNQSVERTKSKKKKNKKGINEKQNEAEVPENYTQEETDEGKAQKKKKKRKIIEEDSNLYSDTGEKTTDKIEQLESKQEQPQKKKKQKRKCASDFD